VRSVTVDGRDAQFEVERLGDVQRAAVTIPAVRTAGGPVRVVFAYDEGTEVYAAIDRPERGATTEGLRILRSRAEAGALHLTLEGLAGRTYALGVRSPRSVGEIAGVKVLAPAPTVTAGEARGPIAGGTQLEVTFDGPAGQYVRRTIDLPLR
jgi:hypothetical protein